MESASLRAKVKGLMEDKHEREIKEFLGERFDYDDDDDDEIGGFWTADSCEEYR